MCMYTCMCGGTYMYIHERKYLNIYIHVHMHICVFFACEDIHVCVSIYVSVSIRLYVQIDR